MATNNQYDKALTENQAFIQSLYDNLPEQNGEDITDHPSEQLDQSILSAAHKAVATPPSPHKTQQSSDNIHIFQGPAHKRKKMTWYYPAATAASLLLVITIVHHQLNGPINPIYEAPLATIASLETITNIGKSESKITSVTESKQDGIIADSHQPLMDHPQLTVSQNKKVMTSRSIEQQFATKKISKSKASAMRERQVRLTEIQTQQRLASNNKEALLTTTKVANKQKSASVFSARALSYQTYKTLQAQSKQKTIYWLLQQENDSSYVIELFTAPQRSRFYRLNKSNFQLKQNNQNKKAPFSAINYITEN